MYINDVHHFIALVNGNQSIVCPSTAINPLFARQRQSIHCLPVNSNQSIVCPSTAINSLLFACRQQSIHCLPADSNQSIFLLFAASAAIFIQQK